MSQAPSYFERIQRNAEQRWNMLERDPDLAGPWHQLFKQIQSPRHVLSELLQNADDAGATEANVQIESGVFSFEHNGRDFTEEDFASLCRFGYSNKRMLHTIGFRGIGFKSTFSLGKQVELLTPTLSVSFERHQFTRPRWSDNDIHTDDRTCIRVEIADHDRQRELEKNLQEWLKSPVSLLFFSHIRRIRIGEEEVHWVDLGPGLVSDSRWMALHDDQENRYLVVHSMPETFPQDALAEIRDERMLTAEEQMDHLSYEIQIVLGAAGHLYVVLPTGVETSLPFACNAPFIQDPARLKVKDPETSPTNRWLLKRIGWLAASTMLGWLQDSNLIPDERAQAYDLMPSLNEDNHSLEGVCAALVQDAFGEAIRDQRFLLTDNDSITVANESVIIPHPIYDIWTSEQATKLLDDKQRPILSRHVSPANREKLLKWGVIDQIDQAMLLYVLQSKHFPRPTHWEKLLLLWEYIAPAIDRYWLLPSLTPRELKIVPVHGEKVLHSAAEVVRLGEKRLLKSEEDWQFLASYLVVLDQNWTNHLADRRSAAEKEDNKAALAAIHSVFEAIKTIGLDQASDVSRVIDRVAATFFTSDKPALADCVRLTQIAAKLGARIGDGFQYYTVDLKLKHISTIIIADTNGTLEDLLPQQVQASQLLHSDYAKSFVSCTHAEWSSWVSSGYSGLHALFPFTQNTKYIWQVEPELRKHGLREIPRYLTAGGDYRITDWDFHESYWHHWHSLAAYDERVWARLMELIFDQPVEYWNRAREAQLMQPASRRRRYDFVPVPSVSNLLPSWALKFRDLPCLRDTRGFYHKPTDLLRRTQQTEALIDAEPFVDHALDREATRPLLDILGVQSNPSGPERLLDRVRALSLAQNPPTYEVEKWYRRLDQIVVFCSTAELEQLKQAFLTERLILAADGSWVSSSAVYLASGEDDVPGASVIRPSVVGLSFWSKIGVADRPTADLAIRWLQSLPSEQKLPSAELTRVQAVLVRYPRQIWNECGHWLNLADQWVPVNNLLYGLTRHSLIPWTHLFEGIKQQTADLRYIDREIALAEPFSALLVLAHHIENHLHCSPSASSRPENADWLNTVGHVLRYLVLDNESKEEIDRLRGLADDLAHTVWQNTPGLEIIPYIDGTPVGIPRRIDVVWLDQVLYVDDVSRARLARLVPEEIGKRFDRPDIKAALDYSFERTPTDIREYLEGNFRLTPHEHMDGEDESSPPVPQNIKQTYATTLADPEDAGGEGPAEIDSLPLESGGTISGPEADIEQITLEESSEQDMAELAKESETRKRPSADPKSRDLGVMERFAAARGFRKDGPDRFFHADGSWMAKTHGRIFPWERGTISGDVMRYYWAKDHCLERDPLEIDAEVWEMLRKHPDTHSLILIDIDGKPMEVGGTLLVAREREGKIKIYPAAYRLVSEIAEHV